MKRKESNEQMVIIQWAEMNKSKYCELSLIYHVGNGGTRHIAEAANLKRQGVKPGVPDLVLPVARGGYFGLYIELKADENGKVSEHQKKWLKDLKEQGYMAGVCYGAEEAISVIKKYLSMPKTKVCV